MPHPLLIFSQSGYLIQIVAIDLHTWWQTVQIQISWLLQKPTDLDLHCLQRQSISGFSRTRVNINYRNQTTYHFDFCSCIVKSYRNNTSLFVKKMCNENHLEITKEIPGYPLIYAILICADADHHEYPHNHIKAFVVHLCILHLIAWDMVLFFQPKNTDTH